jgi:hypothetical protein
MYLAGEPDAIFKILGEVAVIEDPTGCFEIARGSWHYSPSADCKHHPQP